MKEAVPDLTTIMTQMILAVVEGSITQIEANLKKKILVENSPVLRIDNVEEMTGLKRSTIYNYMSSGKLTFYKLNSKHVYFKMEDITNFIFSQKHKSKLELRQEAFSKYLELKK